MAELPSSLTLCSVPSGWFIGCALQRTLLPGISKGIYFRPCPQVLGWYSYVRLRSTRIFLNVPPNISDILELKKFSTKKLNRRNSSRQVGTSLTCRSGSLIARYDKSVRGCDVIQPAILPLKHSLMMYLAFSQNGVLFCSQSRIMFVSINTRILFITSPSL